MRLAIDACRMRSGGGIAHIVGILAESLPRDFGIDEVHLFAPAAVQARVSNRTWLIKHTPKALSWPLPFQLMWQATRLPQSLTQIGCDLLFTADASTVCEWGPSVVLSHDMLSYEPGIMRLFGFSRARARLEAIKAIQNRAMRRAAGVIFLTRYASEVIQTSCGRLDRVAIIPHGIDPCFRSIRYVDRLNKNVPLKVSCTYVSNAALYKNQWVVVEAISKLREDGIDVTLTLIGGGGGPGLQRTHAAIRKNSDEGEFVSLVEFIDRDLLLNYLAATDIFVFASSCENLPVTLLEGMAAGLPIACSDRGPMPEVLQKNGVYFDPTSADSIAAAIRTLIEDQPLRVALAAAAKRAAEAYTWSRCANQTWEFLARTYATAKSGAATALGSL